METPWDRLPRQCVPPLLSDLHISQGGLTLGRGEAMPPPRMGASRLPEAS